MPGKLKAKIVAGRHLPVMDRASDLTDAFVEVSNVVLPKRTRSTHQCVSSNVCRLPGEIRKYDFQN